MTAVGGDTPERLDTRSAAPPDDPAGAAAPLEEPGPHSQRDPWGAVMRRPLVAVAAVASAVAVGHAVWIWTHRRVGALDPDEAGYLANALRYARMLDPFRPWRIMYAIGTTGTGPTVPTLSVPFLLIGPRDPRTAMMVQPLLLVVAAVTTAGITRRLAGPLAAISAGLVVVAAPTVALATQSYWLGLGAATCALVAAWTLLSSDRLRNDLAWAFGAAVGVMVVTRTMTLGYAPGLFVAAAVMAGRDRAAWRGVGRAAVAAGLVAGPWWAVNWRGLSGYLFSYGFGPRAALFGSGTVLDRVGFRVDRLGEGVGLGRWAGVLVAVAASTAAIPLLGAARRGELDRGRLREASALAVAVACGFAALVSTTNNGVWFELPILLLLVPLATALLSRAWAPLRVALLIGIVLTGTWTLGRAWWWIGPGPGQPPDSAHYEYGFAQYDARFDPDRRREQDGAAADWAAVSRDVEQWMLGTGTLRSRPVFVLSGNFQMFNTNSLQLAAELDGWAPHLLLPDTADPEPVLRSMLTPTAVNGLGDTVERVVLVARHRHPLFTPDLDVGRFDRLAGELGWEEDRSFALPGGGEVAVLRHRAGA